MSLAVLSLIMLPWIRRWFYELCIKSHVALGILAIVTIWIHLKARYQIDGLISIATVGIFILSTIAHFGYQLFRSVTRGQPLTILNVERLQDAIKLTFSPSRPWKVQAGQYAYLRIPGARLLSFAESHPFNIVAWEQNGTDKKASRISALARVRSGLTRDVFLSPHDFFRVFLDGPYGKTLNTDHCDSIVFIATDIGITAHLPYVQELILRHRDAQRKRRICLIWELEREGMF